jgi:hypothetical protein
LTTLCLTYGALVEELEEVEFIDVSLVFVTSVLEELVGIAVLVVEELGAPHEDVAVEDVMFVAELDEFVVVEFVAEAELEDEELLLVVLLLVEVEFGELELLVVFVIIGLDVLVEVLLQVTVVVVI